MSDTTLPSWRVRPPERARAGWGIPLLGWLLAGGVLVLGVLVLLLWTGGARGPGSLPVIQAEERPFRVRPEGHVAPAPPPPGDLIFERPGARQERLGDARLSPGPERPMPDGWRQATTPAPRPAPAPAAQNLQPAPTPTPRPPAPAATPRPATGGVQVQLGALPSEEAAMAEWNRLRARVPELARHSPNVVRFDREGRPPFWRLRVGGLPDRDAAQALCEQVRARGGNCAVLGS